MTTMPMPAALRSRGKHRSPAKRSPALYRTIIFAWVALCIPLTVAAHSVAVNAFHHSILLGIMSVATSLFVAYFWLNGLKDVAYPLAYRFKAWRLPVPPRGLNTDTPNVGLVYVTCNDFSGESLGASLIQDYPHCYAVILDDSSNPEYITQVNYFAEEHGIPVIRRKNRKGYKAGNLNHFLQQERSRTFQYFVIIDSDEILPADFVTRALDYFAAYPDAGIVQANHIATRNRTTFMRTFAPGVDAHWPAYQSVKDQFGFLSLLGHGAMISREAYDHVGEFPEIVAEDLGFAIDIKQYGFRTVFAPDIMCEEEFPPDYAAFKKRHRKWTEGNMEFIRLYTTKILFSHNSLRWYEKLDIVLFTYSLPLTGVFSLYVIANAIVFPLMGFSALFPVWMLVPTVVFLAAPMMNDVITWSHTPKSKLTHYLFHSFLLFGSVYFTSLFASLRTVFQASVFHVTPKKTSGVGLRSALRQNRVELISAGVLMGAVEYASGSVLPVILLAIPAIFGIYLSVLNTGDDQSEETKGHHMLHKEGSE